MQGAAPSPSSPARRWGSPLLFPCWGLGQAAFGPSQRRDGQERAVLPAASWEQGAQQQERGHPEHRGRVLLCSADDATLHLVPRCPESTMLGDRSSSAHVLRLFLGPKPPPGLVHARSRGGKMGDGGVWEERWHRPWQMSC